MTFPQTPNRSVPPATRWVVCKFGGTCVQSADRWRQIAAICQRHLAAGIRPLVVCSALRGISDLLESAPDAIVEGAQPGPLVAAFAEPHYQLASACGIEADALIEASVAELAQMLQGLALTHDCTPRFRARLLSMGELLLTRLGAAILEEFGVQCGWCDARDLLTTEPPGTAQSEQTIYLSAVCTHEEDGVLQARLESGSDDVLITQGFLARTPGGDTALLGRGGSDTSAAYFGTRLEAELIEIWTDVPGIFSANPSYVPEARLVKHAGYDEALMLASLGANVLHPRAIAPARAAGIPLAVRWIEEPELPGTWISPRIAEGAGPSILAVTSRPALTLMTMDRPADWQQIGFLADVTQCFRQRGLSIDLITTSPSHIHVTLDPAAGQLTAEIQEQLLTDLTACCHVEVLADAASVSVVGIRLRQLMPVIGDLLTAMGSCTVHLMAQAANDTHLTVVVPATEAPKLVERLHESLFAGPLSPELFGESWQELQRQPVPVTV